LQSGCGGTEAIAIREGLKNGAARQRAMLETG
jgi:hypothetical protein